MKKVYFAISTVCLLFALSITAFAASQSVDIVANQYSAEAGTLYTTEVYTTATNKESSSYDLQVSTKYKSVGIWYNDSSMNLGNGASITRQPSQSRSTRNWKCRIDPAGTPYGGCFGNAIISDS